MFEQNLKNIRNISRNLTVSLNKEILLHLKVLLGLMKKGSTL